MNNSLKKGLSYGVTSGVITTLGLLIGLYSSTNSKGVVLSGILTIAFADAFSDGLGIHISEESENNHSKGEIWESTIATVIAKMLLGLSFIIPILFFSLNIGVLIDIIWGILSLLLLSYFIAKQNKEKSVRVIIEHLSIAAIVISFSFFIGKGVNIYFN